MSPMAVSVAAHRMDAIYRRQRHIYDLTRKYYLLGRDGLIRALDPPAGGLVVEVGCGTARNLIQAARLYPDTRFLGLDISAEMLATARAKVAKAGLADRITLMQADAAAFTLAAPADRIFLSYTLSMIPPWRAVIDRAAAALAEGGRLHIVDFGQCERLPRWFRRALFAWLARFDVIPRAALPDAVAEIAGRRRLIWETEWLYRGYAWRAVLKRG
jgi:S-adenosylmethionine-diacylgycerolhomoserine-N-methlytransferase